MDDPIATAQGRRAPETGTSASAHAALLATQLCFSTLPIAAKYYVLPYLPPPALVLLRVLGAAAVFIGIARWSGRRPITNRRDLARLAFYAALGVALNQLLFVGGLSRTTPVNAQLIGTTIPAFTLMFGVVMGVERLSGMRIAGIVLAAAGAIFLVGPDRVRLSPDTTIGNAMIVANALAYSLYLVLAKPILMREDSVSVMAWVFVFGAALVAPFGAVSIVQSGAIASMPAEAWAGLAFIVLVPTVGSYLMNAWALGRSSPSVVAVYVYLQPFLTGLIAVSLHGERLDSRALPSAALIFAGVALATRRADRG
jgi:drug/metabolite transporter (DMT)-like permease